MKRLAILISVLGVLSPAFGQSPARITLKGVPTRPMPPIVRMAHKPLVLSKGRVLTPADKAQLIASARLAFAAPKRSAKPMSSPAPAANPGPATQTISVAQPSGTATFTMAAYNVGEWDPTNEGLLLNMMIAPNQSFLGFNVTASPNNLYVLSFQVYSYCPAQFSISTAPDGTVIGGQPTETVSVAQGTSGFAYAFDATAAGGIWIQVAANCPWEFQSAELTTTPN